MLVGDFLSGAALRSPGKTAIVCDECRVRYSELDDLSSRFASVLRKGGVLPGDRVAVHLGNSVEAAVAVLGILKAGAVFVVLGQTMKTDKLKFILDDCGAKALVTELPFLGAAKSMDADVESLELIVLCRCSESVGGFSRQFVSYDQSISQASPLAGEVGVADADLAGLIYTSGTTGFPNGVAVSHLNIISATNSITQYLENNEDDVILNFLPMSFDYGLYQLFMSVRMGATLVLEKSFAYPYQIFTRVHQERVTGFPGVPTVFSMLLKMQDVSPDLFDSVRYVTNTAAALPPNHISGLKGIFRNARIYSMYGLTECKRVSYLPPEDIEKRPTSVGKGMPNQRVQVVDEKGNEVPPGTVGELTVIGSNVMQGYWNRPKETQRAIRTGRYPWERVLYTGDLFKMDEDGYLYFVSRKDDIIKSRGEKVSPLEVERIIYELDEVQDVAVTGEPDDVLGEAIAAHVVLAQGADVGEKEIISHCSQRLESFMVPRRVNFLSELPKTPSGKIRKRDLQQPTDPANA